MTLCYWQQFLDVEQRAKDQYDLEDCIWVSSFGIARSRVHAHPIGVLIELTSRVRIKISRVQAQVMPSVKVRLTREEANLAAGRIAVRGRKESGQLLSSMLEQSAVGGRSGR